MKLFYKLVIMIFIYNLSSISARSAEVPPSLVTDLSKKVISINVSFSGSKFHIFGAIKKYASHLGINRKIKIPNDSEIIITSEGLLGGNYVSISPGGSDIFLKANEKFSFTQSSLSLNNLIQKFFGK